MFTSRKEIGSIGETYVYVRFPYYLAEDAQSLAAQLGHTKTGAHQFSAFLTFEGRSKVKSRNWQIPQWDLVVGGHKLPALSKEQVDELKVGAITADVAERMEKNHEEQMKAVVTKDAERSDMLEFLWQPEIDHIFKLKTYRFANLLASPKERDHMLALFQIGGIIIKEADKGVQPGGLSGEFMCLDGKKPFWPASSALFMPNDIGSMFFTMDAPFNLTMSSNEYIEQDSPQGVKVVYCLKFKIGGTNGINVEGAGLVFLQHCTLQSHYARLFALASQMGQKIAEFGATIACQQAEVALSEPASSVAIISVDDF